MREWVANRLVERLAEVDVDGSEHAPGADLALRVQEPDGTEIVLVSKGDSFDLIHGQEGAMRVMGISQVAALRLAWFLLWSWFVRATWVGWKLSAWRWAMHTRLDEKRWRNRLAHQLKARRVPELRMSRRSR